MKLLPYLNMVYVKTYIHVQRPLIFVSRINHFLFLYIESYFSLLHEHKHQSLNTCIFRVSTMMWLIAVFLFFLFLSTIYKSLLLKKTLTYEKIQLTFRVLYEKEVYYYESEIMDDSKEIVFSRHNKDVHMDP